MFIFIRSVVYVMYDTRICCQPFFNLGCCNDIRQHFTFCTFPLIIKYSLEHLFPRHCYPFVLSVSSTPAIWSCKLFIPLSMHRWCFTLSGCPLVFWSQPFVAIDPSLCTINLHLNQHLCLYTLLVMLANLWITGTKCVYLTLLLTNKHLLLSRQYDAD